MGGSRAWSFVACCALSLIVHVTSFAVVRRRSAAALQAVEPSPREMSGDTLEVEPVARPDTETRPSGIDAPGASGGEPKGLEAGPRTLAGTRHRAARGQSSASDGPAELFGAIGARWATDLTATFTRAIPQAFSADPAWSDCAFGPAGVAEVTLTLDEAGRLISTAQAGIPSYSLHSSIERTFALLAPRAFTARQRVTRIRVTARVVPDDVHDGLHGDVFALSGGSFVGGVGSAFFALPARSGRGRRVDVEIRLTPQ